LLSDATNVIFSNTDVDQALRWSLSEYSLRRPLIRTYDFTVVATTGVHTLPADFVTRQIVKVELWDSDADSILELTFYAVYVDEQWVVNTMEEVSAGEVLQISYSAVHQVDGLDSAAGTTVPTADETLLQVGAAGRAAQMRALDRIETINMNKDVVAAYQKLGSQYISQFEAYLSKEPGIAIALMDYPGNLAF
jgi:hypothetical protein